MSRYSAYRPRLVTDIDRTTSWYVDGLGCIRLFTLPGSSGPLLVHLRRWQFQDLLVHPASEPIRAGTGCSLNFAAVYDELDELAARARVHGAGRVDGPADTPWNTRDLTSVDPDGNVVIFTAARPPDQADAAFNEQMHRWNDEQGITTG
ncbi:MAG: hypothetical protein ACR2NR_01865 [Solirubrobacteraceae bacterium]